MLVMILLYSFLLILLQGAAFNKVHGLRFVTEPNKTTMASIGSNQTFTWKLSLTEQEKSRHLQVMFGPWNKGHDNLEDFLILFVQEPTGNESVLKKNHSIAKRLYWAGDLTRDYFVILKLFNVQHHDFGDYGIRIRVDGFPPLVLFTWFTLALQFNPPIITLKSVKDRMVFENTSLILECDAEGYPVPWVAWIWKDKVLQNCTDGPKYLLRRHVTTEEAGNYTCMAGNSAGNTKYTFQVTVNVAERTRDTRATSNVHLTVDKPTGESKATTETHSTVDKPTRESKTASTTHSTDPVEEGVLRSRLGIGLGIGLPTGFAVGIIVTVLCTYVCYYSRKKSGKCHAANPEALCESDDRDEL